MLKAVFIDYTGTMVREDEPYTRELVRYFASHSELKDPNEILRVVWTKIKEIEAESYGDSFRHLCMQRRGFIFFGNLYRYGNHRMRMEGA